MRSKVKQAGLSGRLWAIAGFVLMGSLGVIQTATSAPLALPMTEPEEQGISTTRLALLDALAERYVEEGRVAGMVNVVIRNGNLVYAKATGDRSVESDDPLRLSDLFRIYSMTKPITAVAAMQLYEQGKFHLSDPVEKFVPELAGLKVLNAQGQLVDLHRPVNMHDLLTHTAGFSYGFAPMTDVVDARYAESDLWAAKDLDDFAQRVAKLPLKFQPGARYHYSIAVDLTGLVVERISGVSFDRYLQDNIFAPLGMTDTFLQSQETNATAFYPITFLIPARPSRLTLAVRQRH